MKYTEEVVQEVARDVLGFPNPRRWSPETEDRKFRAHFGAPIAIVTDVWNRIEARLMNEQPHPNPQLKHLFWALIVIKVYASEEVHCGIVGWPDPKTFRVYSWYILEMVSDLSFDIIKWENRFNGYEECDVLPTDCFIAVDGVDCPVNEPWPWEEKWYSKKFNGPGVKYEVGTCIKTGHIVWVNRPFSASESDLTIFRSALANALADDEGAECDGVYKGHPKLKAPTVASTRRDGKQKSVVRGRHEIVNGWIKQFNVLNFPFRELGCQLGS